MMIDYELIASAIVSGFFPGLFAAVFVALFYHFAMPFIVDRFKFKKRKKEGIEND